MKNINIFKDYDSLGFNNPYYVNNNEFLINRNFNNIIRNIDSDKRIVDPTAIIEFINKTYFLGDRSIVQGVNKTPWLAKPSDNGKSSWEYSSVYCSMDKLTSETSIAKELINLLQVEILNYCQNKKTVGILLSGGMDSRVTAAILNHLIKTNQLNVNVVALTWGAESSRDVQYSKKIAKYFGWDWKGYKIDAEILQRNISTTAEMGCEFSPIHLHAMPDIRDESGIDCILATSFGDSIGRGVYSGKHASGLSPISSNLQNKFGLIRPNVFNTYSKDIINDIDVYRNKFPFDFDYQKHELDMLIHYMRRDLNPCFGIIKEKIPVFQVFSSPATYKFMLNQDVSLRNDKIYYHLFKQLDEHLLKIPWARTGRLYLSKQLKPDKYYKEFHEYGKWIRNDLSSFIEKKVFSDNIYNLNVFNMDTLRSVVSANSLAKTSQVTQIDRLIVWIASLSEFVNNNKVKGLYDDEPYSELIIGRNINKYKAYYYIISRKLFSKSWRNHPKR